MRQKGLGESTIQRFGPESDHEVIISLEQKDTESGSELDQGRRTIEDTLNLSFRPPEAQAGKLDLNKLGRLLAGRQPWPGIRNWLQAMQKPGQPQLKTFSDLAKAVIQYRNSHGGLFNSFEELKTIPGVSDEIVM